MKLPFQKLFLIASILLGVALSTRGADLNASFDAANKLQEQGHFAEAIAAWKELLKNGFVTGPIYFNEGNAYFKAGQMGQAIAAYRQALLLLPRDADVRHNLELARQQARGNFPDSASRLGKLPSYLSLNEWTILSVAFCFAFFSLLAAKQWHGQWKLGFYIKNTAILTLLCGGGLACALHTDYYAHIAIVTAGESEIHSGPLDESPALFKVRDGTELKVTDEKNGWFGVVDAAYRTGWVRPDQVTIFHPANATQPY